LHLPKRLADPAHNVCHYPAVACVLAVDANKVLCHYARGERAVLAKLSEEKLKLATVELHNARNATLHIAIVTKTFQHAV
jgi:hypothetical protein